MGEKKMAACSAHARAFATGLCWGRYHHEIYVFTPCTWVCSCGCFDQRNISKRETSRGFQSTCAVSFFPCYPWNPGTMVSMAGTSLPEDKRCIASHTRTRAGCQTVDRPAPDEQARWLQPCRCQLSGPGVRGGSEKSCSLPHRWGGAKRGLWRRMEKPLAGGVGWMRKEQKGPQSVHSPSNDSQKTQARAAVSQCQGGGPSGGGSFGEDKGAGFSSCRRTAV